MVDSVSPSLCDACLHLDREKERVKDILKPSVCEAFPQGIPVEIRLGGTDHRLPWPGDNKITFTLRSGEEDVLESYEEFQRQTANLR